MKLKISNPYTKLGAGISASLIAMNAHAQSTASLGSMATAVSGNIWQATDVISTASYVAGACFGMTGILKLKAHADAPANVPITAGMGRLAAGAGLVGVPLVINSVFNTAGVSDQNSTTGITNSSSDRF